MTDDFFTDLDKLIAEESVPKLEPGDITVRMVAERVKKHHAQAKRMIVKWVDAGKMEYIGKRLEPRGQKVDTWRMKA